MLTLQARVAVNDHILFQELESETVLLNLDSGFYLGLNGTATLIWRLACENRRLEDIVHALVAEYDVPKDLCAADLLALVDTLERQGLVTVYE